MSVDDFAGPLDWLLELARAKSSIWRGCRSAFAGALAAALARRDARQIERWAGWTVMAATLAELWSRLLLPTDAADSRAAETEAEALRRRLLARARMRQAADRLEHRPQARAGRLRTGAAGSDRDGPRQRSHRPAARLPGRAQHAGSAGGGLSFPAAATLAGR